VTTYFSKFANFQERASRSEFWWFVVFILLVNVFGIMIDVFTGEATYTY